MSAAPSSSTAQLEVFLKDSDSVTRTAQSSDRRSLSNHSKSLRSDRREDEERAEVEDEDEEEEKKTWKTIFAMILPHVGLFMFAAIYAIAGAFIFLSIERPYELEIKKARVDEIDRLRNRILKTMWDYSRKGVAKEVWFDAVNAELRTLTEALHKAKEDYVTLAQIQNRFGNMSKQTDDAWRFGSAVLFSFTTMATIGYGSVAPATFKGRIVCIFFCLIGTPLAIVTIADLGKYFSEITISLYYRFRKLKSSLGRFAKQTKRIGYFWSRGDTTTKLGNHVFEEKKTETDAEIEELQELINAKTDVPVMMAFAVLVVYIGIGAVTVSLVEGWSLPDSVYYCFITLTTVGFGDMVPTLMHQSYLVPWIIYITIGLAVTTMCIDLVGVHYIEKIHYFGRKFKGTDFLKMLRRRQQLEKFVAAAQQRKIEWLIENNNEFISLNSPVANTVPEEVEEEPPRIPTPPVWPSLIRFTEPEPEPEPEMLETPPEEPPTPISDVSLSTNASVYERMRAYDGRRYSGGSWAESGPELHMSIVLSPSPSITIRERMYAQLPGSPCWSESQDYLVEWREPLVSPSAEPVGLSMMQEWEAFKDMEMQSLMPILRVPEIAFELPPDEEEPSSSLYGLSRSALALDLEGLSAQNCLPTPMLSPAESILNFADYMPKIMTQDPDDPIRYHRNLPVYSVVTDAVDSEHAISSALQCPERCLSLETPHNVTENYCFVVDGDKVKPQDVLDDNDQWRITSHPTRHYFSEDMQTFKKVQLIASRGKFVSARLPRTPPQKKPVGRTPSSRVPSSRSSMNMGSIDLSHSGSSRSSSKTPPKSPPSPLIAPRFSASNVLPTIAGPHLVQSGYQKTFTEVPLEKVYTVVRYYSYWRSCVAFHRIVTVISATCPTPENCHKQRIFVQYLWREASAADKQRVALEFVSSRKSSRLSASSSRQAVSALIPKSPLPSRRKSDSRAAGSTSKTVPLT